MLNRNRSGDIGYEQCNLLKNKFLGEGGVLAIFDDFAPAAILGHEPVGKSVPSRRRKAHSDF